MIRTTAHGDVTQLEFTSWASRLSRMRVHAFAVRGVLIDSGFPALARTLAHWLRAHPVHGAALTHHHEDHAGGAAVLARLGVPLWMPELARAQVLAPAPIHFYRRFSWGTPEAFAACTPFTLPPELEAVPTPGHSADHHVIWDAQTRTVFGGDLFIGVKVRIAHASEDPRATAASLRRVIARGPRRYFDAHRGLLADPIAMLTAKAEWIEGTIRRAEQYIAEGLDDASVARRVLGDDRLGRWYTAGDYTMENWIRGVRRTVPGSLRPCAES
jgi:glyoxylase-like metal-dependent hydrolase (beta-lactamase superfamily II)